MVHGRTGDNVRLLIVEDDKLIGTGIVTCLRQKGYAVDWVQDGDTAESVLQSEQYDAVILDIGLPRKSGLEVLESIRTAGIAVPVLLLTAKDAVSDRISGLDRGADDYMTKPFDLDELSARIRALLRRSSGRSLPVILHAGIELDPASHIVTKDKTPVDLSPKEFAILQSLLENVGHVLSRSRLEESLYSWKDEIESNAVDVHIHYLRKKLGAELIRTIRGVGYIVDKLS